MTTRASTSAERDACPRSCPRGRPAAHAAPSLVFGGRRVGARPVDLDRAARHRFAEDAEHEPRVVGLRVVVVIPAADLRPAERRDPREELLRVVALVRPLAGERVVHREPQAEHPAGHLVPLERRQPEAERLNQPARLLHEPLALDDASPRVTRICPWRRYLSPPCTSFVDRLDVPDAKSCASTRSARSPIRAASATIPAPVIPPPTTITSQGLSAFADLPSLRPLQTLSRQPRDHI